MGQKRFVKIVIRQKVKFFDEMRTTLSLYLAPADTPLCYNYN